MTLGRNSYAIVVTRGHKGDAEALAATVGKGLRFVGLLEPAQGGPIFTTWKSAASREDPPGSRAARHRDRRQTPEEIAVSILAEMIAVRRGVDPAPSSP